MRNLEIEFVLEQERRYLEKNPNDAIPLALGYLEDYLQLAKELKDLEEKYKKERVEVGENE